MHTTLLKASTERRPSISHTIRINTGKRADDGVADRWKARKNEGARAAEKIKKGARRQTVFFFGRTPAEAGGRLLENPHLRARFAYTGRLSSGQRRLTVAWQDLGRPAALGEPAPTREVPDCPPAVETRRKVLAWRGRALSGYRLPRQVVHSALNPCCCYVVSTPDIYPTTVVITPGRNQPTASWSPSTAT
ncbi:hypothetical protein MRX96_018772 [Rhipicephalus microplus]